MKRFLALSAGLALFACSSSSTGSNGGGGGTMTATVDGGSFAPRSSDVEVHFNGGVLNIKGTATSGNTTTSITLNLLNVVGAGTFPLNPNNATQYAEVIQSQGAAASGWTTTLSPGSGTVVLTSLSGNRIEGTFQFTGQFKPGTAATGQKSVSSGSFSVTY